MSSKDNGVVRRAIVTPDKHFPLHDELAIKVLCKAIEMIKPDVYIDLGDIGEWNSFSAWKYKRKQKPPLEFIIPELEKDVADVNACMDIIDESLDKVNCPERHFCEGNHDNWLNYFVEGHPYLPQYYLKNAINLKDRGYIYHPMGRRLKMGKLFFYHGNQYGGQYHAANHIRKLGCNIMYGHWHDLQQASATHVDGPKSAWSIGCLKDMSDESNTWLQNRPVNWAHAFAVVDFYHGGQFTVHVVQIVNGRTSLWGELIEG